jgi:hypothetical protein
MYLPSVVITTDFGGKNNSGGCWLNWLSEMGFVWQQPQASRIIVNFFIF